MGSTSWHLGRGPKSTRGCLEGQGAADAITSSQVPLKGTQPRLAKYPPGLQLHVGQVKTLRLFFLLPSSHLIPPKQHPHHDLSGAQSPVAGSSALSWTTAHASPTLIPLPSPGRLSLVWCVVTEVLANFSRSGQTSRNGVGMVHRRRFSHPQPGPAPPMASSRVQLGSTGKGFEVESWGVGVGEPSCCLPW